MRRGSVAAAAMTVLLGGSLLTVFGGGPAAAETPAERCARETNAYNSAWEATWTAANPGNTGPVPAPPVPYGCRDPSAPQEEEGETPDLPVRERPASDQPSRGAMPGTNVPAIGRGVPGGVIKPVSAIGTSPLGTFSYSIGGTSITVPTGCFVTHKVEGKGARVDGQFAGVDCAGLMAIRPNLFCNTRFDFVYRDEHGNEYRRYKSPTDYSCKSQLGLVHNEDAPFTARYGSTCAEFYVNGSMRGSQCHSITA